MKNVIIVLVIFALGFFCAKYFFYSTGSEQDISIEAIEQEVYEELQVEGETSPAMTENETTSAEAPSNKKTQGKPNLRPKEKTVSTPKTRKINDRLNKLDQEISKKLNKLKEMDSDYAAKLQKEINEKSKEPMPGDDKYTEKEYQKEVDENSIPGIDDMKEE